MALSYNEFSKQNKEGNSKSKLSYSTFAQSQKPKTSTFSTVKNVGKEIVKSVAKLPARVATNIYQGVTSSSKTPFSGEFLGDVQPIGTKTYDAGGIDIKNPSKAIPSIKADVKDVGGAALELASYLPFGKALEGGYLATKLAAKGAATQAVKKLLPTAAEGAIGAFTGSIGQQMQEPNKDVSFTEAAQQAKYGAVAAPVLSILGRGIGKVFNRGEVPAATALIEDSIPTQTVTPNISVRPTADIPATVSSIINEGKASPLLAQQAVEETQFTPSLSSRVEADAVEKGLTTKFEGLPEVQTMNMRKQAEDALALVDNNYEQAKRVALGIENAPGDLRDASVFEAVKVKALKDNDIITLKQLATESTVPARISAAAQQVKAADARLLDSTDPVELMQTVIKAREKGVQLKQRAVKSKDTSEINNIIKKSSPKRQDWNEFINSIEC